MKTPLLAACALAFAASARAAAPEQDALRDKAVAELFNLDFAQSRADMRRLINNDPENPLGYLFDSGILWWQASAEYGLFKDTPTLQGIFESDVDNCVNRAKPLLDSKDLNAQTEGLFASGMCYGVRGQWDITRGKYLKAYRDGKKSMKHLRKCVKLSPDFHDAYLGLGIFDYQTDHLPVALKLSAIFIARGDAELGKARMREAAEKGKLVSRQAEIFLMSLLVVNEKNYAGGLNLLDSLIQAYPKSPYFHFVRTVLLHKLGQEEASYRQARGLLELAAADPEIMNRKQLAMLCGLTGPECLKPGTLREAGAWLDGALAQAAKEPPPSPEAPSKGKPARRGASAVRAAPRVNPTAWRTALEFYRGVVHDMSGERGPAQQNYRNVLARTDFGDLRARAKACLDAPCDADAVTRILKEMSLRDAAVPADAPRSAGGSDRDGDSE